MESESRSSSGSVSPPTPDTPVGRRQTSAGGNFDVSSPNTGKDVVSSAPTPDVAFDMNSALDAAAKDEPEDAQKDTSAAPSPPPYEETLWDILGVPPPTVTASQHTCQRVVLVGRGLSGKRTVCRRLCVAAEREFPSTLTADDDDGPRLHTGDMDDEKRGLYWPDEDADDMVDTEEWPEADAGRRFNSGTQHRAHQEEVPHGAGISHDYVIQRFPRPVTDAKTGQQRTHRVVEFFCCDCAGALAMAIPTLESLETAVVCHVVDVSQPCSIEEQLNTSFRMVQTHVASVLRTFLPQQDEVRRVQMMEKMEAFWLREEHQLRAVRAAVQARSADETLVAPGVQLDDVNRECLRLPQGTPTVSPLKAIIVCTKTDKLEHLSRACTTADTPLTEEERALMDVLIPEGMRHAMDVMNCALPQLVAQLVRHYAIHHRCALAAVSGRVHAMSAPTAGEHIPLVNPLYRVLWQYIVYLLQPRSDGAAEAADESLDWLTHASTAKLYPGAFLPCGLDALGLLNEFVASEQVSMPPVDPMRVSTPPPEWDHAAALRGCAAENGFQAHQTHLQRRFAETCGRDGSLAGVPDAADWGLRSGAAVSGRSDGLQERGDEPMIWETL